MDADGNYIVRSGSNGYEDTVGRSIPATVVNNSPTGSQTASCTGPLSISEIATWTPPGYSQPFTFCYVNVTYTLSTPTTGTYQKTALMLQSIVLPNKQTWTFEYSEQISNCGGTTSLADLTQITFPTGGTINYAYECVAPLGAPGTTTSAVTSRTVNANDGTGAHTWNYSYTGLITTITDPLNNATVQTLTLGSTSSGTNATRVTQYYSGSSTSGTVMKTDSRVYPPQYANLYGFPLYPSSETIKLDNGLSTETTFSYCCDIPFTSYASDGGNYPSAASYGKVTDTKVYDYATSGLGTLLKETATSYLFQSNSTYVDPGFFDLVSTQTEYNGNGAEMAQTTYGYDQTSRVTSGIASLSGSQMTTPLYSVYGNETTKTAWLNTGPSNPATTVSYYDTGEAYQTTDPLGHVTSTYFCTGTLTSVPCTASTYMGALPTAVVNAKSQETTFTYRTDTGQKLTVTDPNSQTTTYGYINPSTGVNDYLNRLTSIQYPDTGLTSIQYNDSGNIGVTGTEKITSSLSKQTQAIVDGLGRLSQTILLSDPSGATYTQTTYDALGRKYQVWNPTRCVPTTTACSGESTWGITTYNYDALSREILEIPPDGSSTSDNIKTSYSGNTVTTTDEAGNVRTTNNDALGRLTQVSEGSVSYITVYTYDALSNLTCVEQHGGVSGTGCSAPSSDDATSPWRVRRFTYDSLSRLLTAKNPETGTITYGYNADSFLTTKTENRGIAITYTPDALNRVTSKSYSDGEPTISYTYDAYTSGTNYGVGRRTGMTDGSGSTTWTYDTMGRIWKESQTIGSINMSTGNTYNYDGSVATTTYPSSAVIAVTPGADGRPTAVTDTTNGINYASSLVYVPTGQLSTALYGYVSSNLLHDFEQVGGGGWGAYCSAYTSNMTLDTPVVSAPDGSQTATQFVIPSTVQCGGSGTWGALIEVPGGLTAGNTYTVSAWLRGAAGGEQVVIGLNDCANSAFTLTQQWQQYTLTYSNISSAITNCEGGGYGTRGFQVYSTEPNADFYVWGPQTVQAAPTYAGITQTNTYNSRGQPLELRACGLSSCADGSGSPYLLDLSYNYGLGTNDSGNVLGITNNKNTARSQAFTYDSLNRILTAKEGTAWGVSFTTSTGSPGIDAWGNVFQTSPISGTSINPMSMTQVIGDNNRFTVNGYGYDAAGNVLSDGITIGCGSYGYTWNAEEQMTCAAGSTYTYDGDGIRVEKAGGNATPTMYWGAGNLAESNTGGTLTSEYIFAGGKRIARRDISTGSVYYYFADELGSSSVLATASGGVENESDYYPFGGESVVTQSLTNQHYKFEGKERDPETGLDNFGARFSNSNMGRFMSPDWASAPEPVPYSKLMSPQSLNLYAFAQNNPESASDLDGHQGMISCDLACGIGMSDYQGQMAADAYESFMHYYNNVMGLVNQVLMAAGASQSVDPNYVVPIVDGQRPLKNKLLLVASLGLAKHSYLRDEMPNDTHQWEVLGDDGPHNQQVRDTIQNPNRSYSKNEQTTYVSEAQAASLNAGASYFAQKVGGSFPHPCPVCTGSANIFETLLPWGHGYNLIFHNSNSFVYNMQSQNPAGRILPSSAPLITPGYGTRRGPWYP